MKKIMNYVKSFVIAAMVLTSGNVWGWTWTGENKANGTFYFYNKGSQLWIGVDGSIPKTYSVEDKAVLLTIDNKTLYLNDKSHYLKNSNGTTSFASGSQDHTWEGDANGYLLKDNVFAWETNDTRFMTTEGNDIQLRFPKKGSRGDNYNKWILISKAQMDVYKNRIITFAASVEQGEGGTATVSGAGTDELANFADRNNEHSKTVTFSATPNSGKVFVGWSETQGGTIVSEELEYSVTLTNNYNESGTNTESVTLYANFGDLFDPEVTASKEELLVEETAILSFNHVTSGLGSPIITDGNVISYNAATKTVTALNAGTATISFEEPGSSTIKHKTISVTFTVSKHENPITVNGSSAFEATLAYGDELPLTIVSANSANTIEVTQNSGEEVAVYENGKIVTNYHAGTATWTVSQAENYKYKAGSATISATVTNATSSFCDMLNGTYLSEKNPEGNEYKIDLPSNGIGYAGRLYASLEKKGGNPKMKIYQYVDGNRLEIEELGGSLTESWKEFSYVLNPNATAVAFQRSSGLFNIHVKDVRVERLANITPSVASLTLPKKTLAAVNSQATFDVNWSCSDGGDIQIVSDNAHFSVSPSVIGNTSCNGGKNAITVTYTSDEVGSHEGKIIIYNRTHKAEVNVSATTVGKLTTNIEYIGAASYAVNADNMSATDLFKVVDVNGDEVATPVITLATSDAEKINVVSDAHAIDFLCGGSATITASYAGDETYAAAANVEQAITVTRLTTDAFVWEEIAASYEVETEIPSLATANSGLAVTYTSNNESVIKIVDGKIMTIGKGSAQLTAHTAGDCTYGPIEESKTITVRPHEQYIDWDQSFLNIVKNGVDFSEQDVALVAVAKDHEGEETGVAISFSVADNGVATIVGNTLHLVGAGTTTITARTADNSLYETTSFEKTIRVRNYGEKCLSYLINDAATHNDIENSNVFQTTWENPYGDLVDATRPFSFDMKTSFWASRTFTIEIQTTTSSWTTYGEKVGNSGDWKTVEDRKLPANCTGIRFRYEGGAVGSASVRSLKIPMASYVSTVEVSPQFTGTAVAYNDLLTNTIAVKFADVPQIDCEVVDFQNNTDDNTLSAASITILNQSRMSLENTCGEYNTYNFALSGNFKKVGTISGRLHFHTAANDHLYVPFELTITPATRTLHWDSEYANEVPAYTNYELDAYCTTDYENLAGIVNYEFLHGADLARMVDGKVYFDKPGLVEIKATPASNKEYVDPANSKETRSWYVKQRDLVVTPLDGLITNSVITYLDAKSTIVPDLSKYTAVDAVTSETVPGSLAFADEGVFNSIVDQKVKFNFTPTDLDVYTAKSIYVPVTVQKKASVATPSAAAITYGQKVSESTLSNTGTTEGTWAWAEADKNIVPDAGMHNLSVHFVPANTNMTELDATVSLTVNKAAAELSWTANPTSATYGDVDLTYTATSVSDGAISYSIVSGADCASIDANTGVLTMLKDGDVTIQATQAEGTNYLAPAAITTQLTIKKVISSLTVENNVEIIEPTTYETLTITENGSVTATGEVTVLKNLYLGAVPDKNLGAVLQGNYQVKGDAYIDIVMNGTGTMNKGYYYSFAVPFSVNVNGGVFRMENGNAVAMTPGVGFLAYKYNEAERAANGASDNCWTQVNNGTFEPGVFYLILFSSNKSNVYRFKWNRVGDVNNQANINVTSSAAGESTDQGWHGVANNALCRTQMTGAFSVMQTLNSAENRFDSYATNTKLAIAKPVFVQMATGTIAVNVPSAVAAPRRAVAEDRMLNLQLLSEGATSHADQIFFSAAEDARNEYELGRDVAKMFMGSAKTAQMWVNAYGQKLVANHAVLENNMAEYPLSISAPAAGNYTLDLTNAISGVNVYLTHDGQAMWNLSMCPCTLALPQGMTDEYGLMLKVRSGIGTDFEEVLTDENPLVRKMMIDGRLIIIRGTNQYDANGRLMNK